MKKFLLVIVMIALVGCASYKTPNYSSDYETLDSLKSYKLKKLAVENVKPESADEKVNKITLRGGGLVVDGGTFATYLGNAIKSDLVEINAYDPNSQNKIEVTLLKNDIDISGFSVGTGEIEVSLKVTSGSNVLLEKNYSANTEFESAFGAIVAIPKGQSEYPKLVKKLLATIFADKQFINTIKR